MPASSTSSYNVVLFLGEPGTSGDVRMGGNVESWTGEKGFVGKVGSRIVVSERAGEGGGNGSGTVGMVVVSQVVRERITAREVGKEEAGTWLRGALRWKLELVSGVNRVAGWQMTKLMSCRVGGRFRGARCQG